MTRLTPDQVKPFILHADAGVRDVAARYFADGHSPDPTVMPLVVAAWEKYGLADGEGFSAAFSSRTLVQTADTVGWLIAAVGRVTGWRRNALADTLVDADIALLQAREAEVRRAVAFEPRYSAKVSRRLELAALDGDRLWRELADRCEAAEIEQAAYAKGWDQIELVVDALGRQGDRHAERTLGILARRFDPDELPTRDVWLLSAAVRLAGDLRLNAAAEHVVAHMQYDWELCDIEAQRALTRIGTDDAIRAVAAAYDPAAADDTGFTIYATDPLGNVHTDLALATCLWLFEAETKSGEKDFLATAVLDHLSADGTRRVLAAIEAKEVGREAEAHVAGVCTMLGIESPVADRIRAEDAKRAVRVKRMEAQWEADQAVMRTNAARPPAKPSAADLPPLSQPLSVQGKSAPAGRNDRCPCGSGKKFKKCCLGKAKRL